MSVPDDDFGMECPPETAAEIDALCDRFEAAWQAGTPTRLESLILLIPVPHRGVLLRHLLLLDVRYRSRTESVGAGEIEAYRVRFPEYAGQILKWESQLLEQSAGNLEQTPLESDVRGFRIGDRTVTHLRDYELLSEIGEGGMGRVFLARHDLLNRLVAVKIPRERELVDRFRREMTCLGELQHDNIAKAYDANLDDIPFLVMEYVDGLDLRKLVGSVGRLPTAEACEIIRQACLGLQHAHIRKMVHRDLKPTNLLLSNQGIVKILDLGLARSDASSQNAADELTGGRFVGTMHYAAPEQADNPHTVDIRGDLYSLGCTLFYLLAAAPPFPGSARQAWLAHQRAPLPDIHSLRDGIPDGLAFLLEKLLAKSPEDRPAVPFDVAQMLAPFAEGADLAELARSARVRQDSAAAAHPDRFHSPTYVPDVAAFRNNGFAPAEDESTITYVPDSVFLPLAQIEEPHHLSRRRWLWAAAGLALGVGGVVAFVLARRGRIRLDAMHVDCSEGWRFEQETALSPRLGMGWLRIAAPTAREWRLSLTAERLEGQRLSLVVVDDRTPLTISFQAGLIRTEAPHVTETLPRSGNGNLNGNGNGVFQADWGEWKDTEPRKLELRVGPSAVRLSRAGGLPPLLDWKGDLAEFSARPPATVPNRPGIYVCTWDSQFRISDADVR